jgi:sulfatase modifying factor 1
MDSKIDVLVVAAFVATSAAAIRVVVARAERDSVDPARCVGLVSYASRCCAEGQVLREGRCLGRPSRCPEPLVASERGCRAVPRRMLVSGGVLRAGSGDWEAEGRITPHDATIAPFEIDAYEITEGAYQECIDAGRCVAVAVTGEPGRALGGITRREAEAYCAFREGRLPTSDEWTFAAGGARSRRYPWGDTGAVCRRGAWGLSEGPCGFGFTGPELAGAHPDGASAEGIHDLAGNVAEWVTPSGGPDDQARGGSFISGLATELRTWHTRELLAGSRSPDVGARCAYGPSASVTLVP